MTAALYHARIVEHDRAPRHAGPLAGATHEATCDNPLCGDVVTVRLVARGGAIEDIAFEARGCAVSRAAASMMTERVLGGPLAAAEALAAAMATFVTEAPDAPIPESLGELSALAGVRAVRSRRACALLPFRALVAALAARRA